MELEYGAGTIEFIIGNIRTESTVNSIVRDVDIFFHAAALKHVVRCELYPFEAFGVNIIETNNVIQASIKENVERVVLISTDIVNPIGVMGRTKLLAEKLISSEAHKNIPTIFCSVRLGNVLHTRGSILPRIEKQIQKGGPITITDVRMKRFFMTKEDAVNLIISATEIARDEETFVLKMPVIKLVDLFDTMKQILAPHYGFSPEQVKTNFRYETRGKTARRSNE